MARCQSGARQCGVFALYDEVVWEGNISLPESGSDTDKVFRVRERRSTSYTTTSTGQAILSSDSNNIKLSVRHNSSYCEGTADIEGKVWHLDCYGKRWASGTIGKGSESLLWGRANEKPVEISIDDRDWPVLRKKLGERRQVQNASAPPVTDIDQYLALVWNSGSYLFRGKAKRTGDSKNGTLVFFDSDNKQVCTGTFEVWYGTTGGWQLNCGDIATLKGTLKVRGGVLSGTGRDDVGGPVTLNP